MNPALYCLSYTAIKQKAARIAPERLLLFGTGALHPVGLSSTSLACPGAAWSGSRREFEKPVGVNHAGLFQLHFQAANPAQAG